MLEILSSVEKFIENVKMDRKICDNSVKKHDNLSLTLANIEAGSIGKLCICEIFWTLFI